MCNRGRRLVYLSVDIVFWTNPKLKKNFRLGSGWLVDIIWLSLMGEGHVRDVSSPLSVSDFLTYRRGSVCNNPQRHKTPHD